MSFDPSDDVAPGGAARRFGRGGLGASAVIDALAEVPPKPAAMAQLLRLNQGREAGRS